MFRLFPYRFETPKQTETIQIFLFMVSQNKPKHNRNRSCFGLTQNFFIYFRGHSNNYTVMKQESKKLQKAEEAEQRAPGSG